MTEHKFTDEEVIKALEVCAVNTVSREGVFTYRGIPLRFLCADALDLINRQKAEIERLQSLQKEQRFSMNILELQACEEYAAAKAVKEFAERLKTYYRNLDSTIGAAVGYFADQVLKEMTEGKER